ncbi:MAG: acylphosphatase [Nitrososphaerota archaeon]
MKVTLRVYGNVQSVGYRALVKNIARLLGVQGLVRNLGDGSVELFVEAPEDVLRRFVKAIDIKGEPGDLLALHVERVEVFREGEPGYAGPWRAYRGFEIDYGDETIRPIEREMVESLEWAKLYFTKLVSEFGDYRLEFRDFREEFREFRDESLKLGRETLEEVKGFRKEFTDYREEFREFRDESLKLGRETLEEVKGLKIDLKTILDERLAKMDRDIAEIKARLGMPKE